MSAAWRSLTAALLLWGACVDMAQADAPPLGRALIAGIITDNRLSELSGLDASLRRRDRFWALNDSGNGNFLLLLDTRGKVLRQFEVEGASNRDWEDLASFHWRGRAWLLIADTGDNARKHTYSTLYLIPEPATNPRSGVIRGARALHFQYEDGPFDVESMTIDPIRQEVLMLTKRTVPSALYTIPLSAFDQTEQVIARRVAELEGIPQPTEADIERDGPLARYRSQTTAMDLDCDGRGLLVLTYDSVYRYRRGSNQSWAEALPGQTPARNALSLLPQAEALAFDSQCKYVYVGSEKIPSPLLRFRYQPLANEQP